MIHCLIIILQQHQSKRKSSKLTAKMKWRELSFKRNWWIPMNATTSLLSGSVSVVNTCRTSRWILKNGSRTKHGKWSRMKIWRPGSTISTSNHPLIKSEILLGNIPPYYYLKILNEKQNSRAVCIYIYIGLIFFSLRQVYKRQQQQQKVSSIVLFDSIAGIQRESSSVPRQLSHVHIMLKQHVTLSFIVMATYLYQEKEVSCNNRKTTFFAVIMPRPLHVRKNIRKAIIIFKRISFVFYHWYL